MPLPVRLIAAPTGTGKTTVMAEAVAHQGSTCWLANRHDDVDQAVAKIESFGGSVGRVLALRGRTGGVPHCLHAEVIEQWQQKGYPYVKGYCPSQCERQGQTEECLFLESIARLKDADNIVVTKALAKSSGFWNKFGNTARQRIVLDEDPIQLLRPAVRIGKADLERYIQLLRDLILDFNERGMHEAEGEAKRSLRAGNWCWAQMQRQPPGGEFDPVPVPDELKPSRAVLEQTKRAHRQGRKDLVKALCRRMRKDPHGMVRNVYRDLGNLVSGAAAQHCFVKAGEVLFHVRITLPRRKDVTILDATGDAALLRPLVHPRPVEVLFDEPVRPEGRIIQFMDFNGPRSYLNKTPVKLVRIIDALGDHHPDGQIVLISHRSCVEQLAKASRHEGRMRTAYFGALRGRNDLEPSRDNPIACHIVAGSPKTTEEDRRQLALAVFGRAILPFQDMKTVRQAVVGLVPVELEDGPGAAQGGTERIWEVRIKGYADPRMQAVYHHTVTAELTQAADRARVLIHPAAVVYLVTNEPCPKLWFAEMCYAGDLLDLHGEPRKTRADFEANLDAYEAKAKELLDQGKPVGNADVCRALHKKAGWGKRYWSAFTEKYGDALEGLRKVRWKQA